MHFKKKNLGFSIKLFFVFFFYYSSEYSMGSTSMQFFLLLLRLVHCCDLPHLFVVWCYCWPFVIIDRWFLTDLSNLSLRDDVPISKSIVRYHFISRKTIPIYCHFRWEQSIRTCEMAGCRIVWKCECWRKMKQSVTAVNKRRNGKMWPNQQKAGVDGVYFWKAITHMYWVSR